MNDDGDPPLDDDTSDEFFPQIVVTRRSLSEAPLIQVAFFSDRRFEQYDTNDPNDPNENPNAQFDVYYTASSNGGTSFDHLEEDILFAKSGSDDAAIRFQAVPPQTPEYGEGLVPFTLNHYFGFAAVKLPNVDDFKTYALFPTSDGSTSGGAHASALSLVEITIDY